MKKYVCIKLYSGKEHRYAYVNEKSLDEVVDTMKVRFGKLFQTTRPVKVKEAKITTSTKNGKKRVEEEVSEQVEA